MQFNKYKLYMMIQRQTGLFKHQNTKSTALHFDFKNNFIYFILLFSFLSKK